MMKVRFWGVRGSIPCATPNHVLYGGNTSCVSVEIGHQFIVFDAGSGVRDAGLYATENNIPHTHMFLSHLHMDHILGFPFYGPLWSSQHQLDIYAGHMQHGLKDTLAHAFAPPLFPIPFSKLPAKIQYHDLEIGHDVMIADNICVSSTALTHPDHATGFRLTYEGKTLCYVTDTEHTPGTLDEEILRLINNADVLIYDSQLYRRRISTAHQLGALHLARRRTPVSSSQREILISLSP